MPSPAARPPQAIVIMGVCGCGKSHIGQRLAAAIGARFIEGDEFHPPENVARMREGLPLDDAHRAGWLDRLAAELAAAQAGAEAVVLSCSALKRRYRDRLRQAADYRLVFLDGSRELLFTRLSQRQAHFMPASLLDSQLATLERPGADEAPLTGQIAEPAEQLLAGLLRQLAPAA